MEIKRERIQKAIEEVLKEKGKRKFSQSVDVAINFQDVDFKKPENRVNSDIVLPFAAKREKVAVFADGQLATDAKKTADLVLSSSDIPIYAADKKKQGELLQYSLLSAPQLMAQIGKALGQFLGSKGKLPKPIMPNANITELIERTRKTVTVRTKGKYLPTVHCIIGKEEMTSEQITENVLAVLEVLRKSITEQQIANMYVKLTMGKPVKIT